MLLCAVFEKPHGKLEPAHRITHSYGYSHAFPRHLSPRQPPDDATHVELTVGNSELIVMDSELNFPCTPLIFYITYIYY